MGESTQPSRSTELSQGDYQVRILTFKTLHGRKKGYRTYVVVLFPIRDAFLFPRFYRGISLFRTFISIQIVVSIKKSQRSSTVRTIPTNSTFEQRTSTSE